MSVLRFPPIARLAAGRMVELGVGRCGDALAEALYRFVSRQDDLPGAGAGLRPSGLSPEAVAFALQFLAHIVWLDVLFAAGTGNPASGGEAGSAAGGPDGERDRERERERVMVDAPGRELAILLAAAHLRAPACLRPRDVPATSDLGRSFARHLEAWFARHDVDKPTLSPSVLVTGQFWVNGVKDERRCHSFVRDGRIQFLDDCTHSLAGKTVDLPEIDP